MYKFKHRHPILFPHNIHTQHLFIIRRKQLPLILRFHQRPFPVLLSRFNTIDYPWRKTMDWLTTRFTGFGIDDFAEEFAEFDVCIKVFCGDGEERVFGVCGWVGGGGGKGGGVFEGYFLDCTVYVVEVGGCWGGGSVGGGCWGGTFVFGFPLFLLVFGFLCGGLW